MFIRIYPLEPNIFRNISCFTLFLAGILHPLQEETLKRP